MPQPAPAHPALSPGIWLALGFIIVLHLGGAISLVIYQLAQHSQPDSTPAVQDYAYQLTGDPAWINSREWQVLNAADQVITTSHPDGSFTIAATAPGEQFSLVHPDWRIEFVGQTGATPSGNVDFGFNEPAMALPLDRELDNFARDFADDVAYHRWAELTALIDPTSLPSQIGTESATSAAVARQMLTVRFNDWFRGIAIKNFNLDDIDVYYNLNKDLSMDGRLVFVWTFTDQNSGAQTLITTNVELVKTNNQDLPYMWKFGMGSFPQP